MKRAQRRLALDRCEATRPGRGSSRCSGAPRARFATTTSRGRPAMPASRMISCTSSSRGAFDFFRIDASRSENAFSRRFASGPRCSISSRWPSASAKRVADIARLHVAGGLLVAAGQPESQVPVLRRRPTSQQREVPVVDAPAGAEQDATQPPVRPRLGLECTQPGHDLGDLGRLQQAAQTDHLDRDLLLLERLQEHVHRGLAPHEDRHVLPLHGVAALGRDRRRAAARTARRSMSASVRSSANRPMLTDPVPFLGWARRGSPGRRVGSIDRHDLVGDLEDLGARPEVLGQRDGLVSRRRPNAGSRRGTRSGCTSSPRATRRSPAAHRRPRSPRRPRRSAPAACGAARRSCPDTRRAARTGTVAGTRRGPRRMALEHLDRLRDLIPEVDTAGLRCFAVM